MRATTGAELYDADNTDEKGKKKKHKIKLQHDANCEWLTADICNTYMEKAKSLGANDSGAKRDLRVELQHKCDITEIEAINILNGIHISEYVKKYEIMRGKDVAGYGMTFKDMYILDAVADAEDKIKNDGLVDENL